MDIWAYPLFSLQCSEPKKLIAASIGNEMKGSDALSQCIAENAKERAAIINAVRSFCENKISNRLMPVERLNILHREQGIYELKPGNLRLVFFYDQEGLDVKIPNISEIKFGNAAIFVLSFRKKQRKAPQSEISEAIKLKTAYSEAKKNKSLIIHVSQGVEFK
jgi:hypothetical protein